MLPSISSLNSCWQCWGTKASLKRISGKAYHREQWHGTSKTQRRKVRVLFLCTGATAACGERSLSGSIQHKRGLLTWESCRENCHVWQWGSCQCNLTRKSMRCFFTMLLRCRPFTRLIPQAGKHKRPTSFKTFNQYPCYFFPQILLSGKKCQCWGNLPS